MHLLRVQVPDFRGLKDIDITFEKDFVPKIFPLGSQNGGGKSTLLQLIFVLLHCSVDEDKKIGLQNLLEGFKIYDGEERRVLAIINIWDGKKVVEIKFFAYKDSLFQKILTLDSTEQTIGEDNLSFYSLKEFNDLKHQILEIDRKEGLLEGLGETDNELENKKRIINEKYSKLAANCNKVIDYLQSEQITYICNYSSDKTSISKRDEALFSQFNNIDSKQVKKFSIKLSQQIFLAAPSTQIFRFLSPNYRKLLFSNPRNRDKRGNNYYGILESARDKLPGLFTYDFLAVGLLIELFKAARDLDFKEAIKTGHYGNSYQALIKELNLLLGNKSINLNEDFSGVNFQLYNNGETIELYPEDLSHGELKRLSIYVWLKSRNIKDAIVLMDEVEIAFHPDWQYQIISDLKEWGPSNQYILATHSYALCEALTPAHVKEIEPKLIKQESNITNES